MLQNGWVAEGNQGWIYVTQVPGSLPLYRLNKTDHVTGDHDHYYTLSYTEVQDLLQSGWALDGVAGYAYSNPSPTVAGCVVLGNRPWLPGSDPRAKALGAFYGPEYPRMSKHARTQLVSFRMTSYGWGAGIAFGALHHECSATGLGPQLVAIELFDNPQINRVFGLGDTPNTCAPTLPEGTPVDVLVSVSDAAQVSFEYRVNGVLFGYGTVNVGGFDGWTPYSGYKLGATGVVITPSTGALQPYTVYIENLQVTWIQ